MSILDDFRNHLPGSTGPAGSGPFSPEQARALAEMAHNLKVELRAEATAPSDILNNFDAFMQLKSKLRAELLYDLKQWFINEPIEADLGVKFLDDEYGKAARKFGLPVYHHEGDAGMDLIAILPEELRDDGLTIFPKHRELIQTGLALDIPPGLWCEIVHRSSTERKYRVRVVPGTIDAGYRGPLMTQISNDNDYPMVIKHGKEYAQMRFFKLIRMNPHEKKELSPSTRGGKGFGSTDKGDAAKERTSNDN